MSGLRSAANSAASCQISRKRLRAHIAGADGQVTAWLHLPRAGNEAHRGAGQAAARDGVHAGAGGVGETARGGLLAHDAVIHGRAGGFEVQFIAQRDGLREEPGEQLFHALRGKALPFGQFPPAPHRHQQEKMQRIRAELLRQFQQFGQFMRVVRARAHVDLQRQPGAAYGGAPAQCRGMAARLPAEGVMCLRAGAIQADAHALDAGCREATRQRVIQQCAVARQRDAGEDRAKVLGDGEEIRAQQRLTTAEDDDGIGDGADFRGDAGEFRRASIPPAPAAGTAPPRGSAGSAGCTPR